MVRAEIGRSEDPLPPSKSKRVRKLLKRKRRVFVKCKRACGKCSLLSTPRSSGQAAEGRKRQEKDLTRRPEKDETQRLQRKERDAFGYGLHRKNGSRTAALQKFQIGNCWYIPPVFAYPSKLG